MQLLLEIDGDTPVTPENLWQAFQKNPKPLLEHSGLIDKKEVYKKFYSRCLAEVATEVLSEVTTIIPATKTKEPTRTMLDCYKCKNNKADVNCEECNYEPATKEGK